MHIISVITYLLAAFSYTYGFFFLAVSLGAALRGQRFNANLDLRLICTGHFFVALGYLVWGL